eukprot:759175-Amphidinium_carterae.1
MREITGPEERQENNERESTRPSDGATEDRKTMVEYNEVREMNNEFELVNDYREIDENKETMEYSEYDQTDAVAQDLQAFLPRYPQAIRHGEDGYDEYMDQWDQMEKKKADIQQH